MYAYKHACLFVYLVSEKVKSMEAYGVRYPPMFTSQNTENITDWFKNKV